VTQTDYTGVISAIKLQVSGYLLNGTEIINVEDYNSIAYINNMTAASSWPASLNPLDVAPCWSQSWPVAVAIASGNYTSSNIKSANFLYMVDPQTTYSCSQTLNFGNAAGYLFRPNSDTAAAYNCQSSYCPTQAVDIDQGLSGWWNQQGYFTDWTPGPYTIFVMDEWGHTALAYFTVPAGCPMNC